MEVIFSGHRYILDSLDEKFIDSSEPSQVIQFVDRGHGHDTAGVTCQEVIRVLIDRVKFLEDELHWDRNKEILYHLRKSLLLFEIRAMERKFDKGEIEPEKIVINQKDGHFELLVSEK